MSNAAAARPDDDERVPESASRPSSEVDKPSARARRRVPVARTPHEASGGLAARVFGVLGVSLGGHMAIVGVLGLMPAPALEPGPKQVEMEILEPPPPPPPAAPEPEPPPQEAAKAPEPAPEPPKPKITPKPAAPKAEPPPQQAEPPKAAAEAPVDLTGVTLTDENASWSSAVGNGAAMNGPAARIGRVTGRDRAGASDGAVGGTGTGPALVGEASLSRQPGKPAGLDELLNEYYPPRARGQGVEGTADVRIRVQPDGRVTNLRNLRETQGYGFGSACMKLLQQKRWQPPLDKHGQPVATEITFTCTFEVAY